MRLNQLDGLLAFWKVAEHRGFTAAAAELEVSPSALSQAIRHLEARLGVRLLNRTTRSVSLTEAGEAYLTRIGPALRDVREAGEELHALRGRPSGVLRINAARIGTAMVLRPLLAGFLKAYPDVQVELTNDEGTSTSSKEDSTPAFAWGRVSKRTWWLCHSAARLSLQSSDRPTTSSGTPFHGTPPTWYITIACDSDSPAVGPSTSGSSRSTAGSSSTSSAAI
jgi:Bacterial regulatory helix-turn-helix protein, lysR family